MGSTPDRVTDFVWLVRVIREAEGVPLKKSGLAIRMGDIGAAVRLKGFLG
jgi:hypothetical protein